jgi:hypothetical protein
MPKWTWISNFEPFNCCWPTATALPGPKWKETTEDLSFK